MATNLEWTHGYARQAYADFNLFGILDETISFPECHKLQFLQMACEKLVKAHLCSEGTDPTSLQTSHAYVAGTLPVVLLQTVQAVGFSGKSARWVLRHARHLAREIELLAPAVKRGGIRPDNCEYPWEDGSGVIRIPLDWSFAPSHLLRTPAGQSFLKLIRMAINNLIP
jgi:hypothetical protein